MNSFIQWKEPEDWARYRTQVAKSKLRLGKELWFFASCLTILLCVWLPLGLFQLWHYQFPIIFFSTYSVAILSVLASFITMIRCLVALLPVRPASKISFRDNGITELICNGQHWDYGYQDLRGWVVIKREFKGRIMQILLLQRLAKQPTSDIAYALPDGGIRDRVVQILRDRQVPEAPDLMPSWEAEE